MITREEVRENYHLILKHTVGVFGSAVIATSAANLRDMCEKLIAERDEAALYLDGKRAQMEQALQ